MSHTTHDAPSPLTSAALRESPLFRGFEAFSSPTDETAMTAIRGGMVVVDANTLLNLYKYMPQLTQDWGRILTAVAPRLFFPHQVLSEFWRNRISLAQQDAATRQAIGAVGSHSAALTKAFRTWLHGQGRVADESERALLDTITSTSTALSDILAQADRLHEERFDVQPECDEVVQLLYGVVNAGAAVGEPFSASEHEELCREADERYAEKIPPGFEDAKKEGDLKYGDFLWWSEVLTEATRRSAPWVVVVTADTKADWWIDPSSRRPHRLLVEELARKSSAHLVQLVPGDFVDLAGRALGVSINPDAGALTDVLGADDLSFDPTQTTFHIKVWGRTIATGHPEPRGFLLAAGSVLKGIFAESTTPATVRKFVELKEAGLLDLLDDGRYLLTEDCLLTSASLAASLVVGSNTSGNARWMTADDQLLGDFLRTAAEAEGAPLGDDQPTGGRETNEEGRVDG